jgi:hypothetical protein
MTPIKPGPFQIGSREDRGRRRCRTPAPLQGLSGIGIPNRKTPARHTGPLCSIRGKSEGVDQEASLTVGLGKPPANRIVAAPKNHEVLYEDDHVRVLEVTVQPGEIENMHHHPCASVFAHDAPMPKFTKSFADEVRLWSLEETSS